MKQTFAVSAKVVKNCNYVVDANTSEEAVSIVESWLAEGETGVEELEYIDEIEATPAEGLDEVGVN